MYLKPNLSSVLKLSMCLTISQFAGLSAMAQTKAIADALRAKNSGQKIAQHRVQTKQVSEPGSTSSFNERVRGGAIIRKKQQLDYLNIAGDGEFKYTINGAAITSKTRVNVQDDIAGKIIVEGTGQQYSVENKFQYGFSEVFSMFLSLAYRQGENSSDSTVSNTFGGTTTKSTNTMTGMDEPTFGVNLKLEGSGVTTVLGASADIKVEDSKQENKKVATGKYEYESNTASGGNSFTPSVAVYTNSNPNVIFGSEIRYIIRNERTHETIDKELNQTRNSTFTNGNALSLSLVSEFKVGASNSVGGVVNLTRSEPTISKSNGGEFKSEGSDGIVLATYANFNINRTFAIAPALTYSTPLSKKVGNSEVEQADSFGAMLRTTLTF